MDADEHRRLGIELYNRTWELLEGGADPDETVHTAHASAYHWCHAAGATAANRARSEWLCSRVYALLGRPEAALHHARRCIELVESAPAEMEDWDKAGAYEALTRAHLAAGEMEDARHFFELARKETAEIAEEDDRKHIEADLDGLPL